MTQSEEVLMKLYTRLVTGKERPSVRDFDGCREATDKEVIHLRHMFNLIERDRGLLRGERDERIDER